METFNIQLKINKKILALGAELDSALGFYYNGKITLSKNLNNTASNPKLLDETIKTFYKTISPNKPTPDCILTDLNPEYNSFKVGTNLAKKWQIPHIKIQHHHAHVFSAITEHYLINNQKLPEQFISIACDGTGYGTDETIWGGEIILVQSLKFKVQSIERLGHLEQQTLLGGQLAIEEPARMLISVLANFLTKKEIYKFVKNFYSQNDFNLLYSQLKQNFNCQKTTSCARVLDAACALLFGFNQRKFKHQAVKILEKNSSTQYDDLKPKIENANNISAFHWSLPQGDSNTLSTPNVLILKTTPLFEYLIKNLNKDKIRLAATALYYIANGLFEITQKFQNLQHHFLPPRGSLPTGDSRTMKQQKTIFSGGMANNKILKKYFEEKNFLLNKKTESGDPGIALGQIGYYLLSPPDKGGWGVW